MLSVQMYYYTKFGQWVSGYNFAEKILLEDKTSEVGVIWYNILFHAASVVGKLRLQQQAVKYSIGSGFKAF